MKKFFINLVIVGLIFILPACNLPQKTRPSADTIATQVAVVLTSMPTATAKATLVNPTAPLSTATQPVIPSDTVTLTTSTLMPSTSTMTVTSTELASATATLTATISSTDPKAISEKLPGSEALFQMVKSSVPSIVLKQA